MTTARIVHFSGHDEFYKKGITSCREVIKSTVLNCSSVWIGLYS